MRYDVTTNGLFGVCSEHSGSINLSHDLVGDDNFNSKLVCDTLKHAKELCKVHLTGIELTSARVICTIEGSGRVDYHKGESVLCHQGSCLD
jgi:hypothetical protein